MNSKDKYWIIISILIFLIIIPFFFGLSEGDREVAFKRTTNIQNILSSDIQQDNFYPLTIEKSISLFNSSLSLWIDINYEDKSRTNWDAINHIKRTKQLAFDYYQNNEHIQNISIINKALSIWFLNNYTCPNWFVNEIAINNDLMDILILVGNILDKDNYQNIGQRIENIQPTKWTGINRIWESAIQLRYGLYKSNISLIQKSKSLIANEIVISNNDENLQSDYSYHFHKSRLQMYAYGRGFVETCIDVANLVRNTDYFFQEDKVMILRSFILNGWQWLARGRYTVPSTMDRTISTKGGLKTPEIIASLQKMKTIDSNYANQYQSLIEQQQDIKQFNLQGTKYFPYSDIAVAHSKNASFFIKVLSDRNLPTESINSENLQGKFLHFGNHFILQDGQEYTNLAGAWDWKLLPGFSYINGADTIMRNSATGVANFNQTIVANMVFNYQNYAGKTLTNLYKIWIVQKDKLICLISSPDKNFKGKIITSLDQTKFRNNGFVNTQKISNQEQTNQLQKNQWLYHNHLVYYSPNSEAIQYQIKKSLNDWKSINNRYKNDNGILQNITLFSPTITQTTNNTSYAIAYVDTISNVASKLIQNSYAIIQNDANAQIVYLNRDSVYCGAVHLKNNTIKINNQIRIASNIPILFLIKNNSIFVTEPTLNSKLVFLKINNKTYKIQLDNVGQGNMSF